MVVESIITCSTKSRWDSITNQDSKDFVTNSICFIFIESQQDQGVVSVEGSIIEKWSNFQEGRERFLSLLQKYL